MRDEVIPGSDQEAPTRAEAQAAAEVCACLLKERFGAARVIPFGSAVGQGPWHESSDLDLAVEGLPPEQFFRAWGALDEVLPHGLQVHLVPLEDAGLELRARILGEVEMPEDPIEALRGLVEDELRTLGRTVEQLEAALASLPEQPSQFGLRGVATYLHEFYTGVESIFERIAIRLGEGLPRGESWHGDLLNWMALEREGIRPAVLGEPLRALLEDYLDFRHFFRHAYGYQLQWVKMRPLAEGMGEALRQLEVQLRAFFDALKGL